jgi:hypothetical protein
MMRLGIVDHGHRPLQKLQLSLIRALVGHVPGPILVMSYRRGLFGKQFAACLQRGMRGVFGARFPREFGVGARMRAARRGPADADRRVS